MLPKEREVTRNSILEYGVLMRKRHRNAAKRVQGKLPDEFTKVTRLHRKPAIQLRNPKTETEGEKPKGYWFESSTAHHLSRIIPCKIDIMRFVLFFFEE